MTADGGGGNALNGIQVQICRNGIKGIGHRHDRHPSHARQRHILMSPPLRQRRAPHSRHGQGVAAVEE